MKDSEKLQKAIDLINGLLNNIYDILNNDEKVDIEMACDNILNVKTTLKEEGR